VTMKKIIYTLGVLILCALFGAASLLAQNSFAIPFQAVARNQQGVELRDQAVEVKVSLGAFLEDRGVTYDEIHYLKTDENGYFNLLIGRGQPLENDFLDLDFSKGSMQIAISIRGTGQEHFYLLNQQQLRTVPYAFHARTTDRVPELSTRSQSIYWTTSGNNKTRPPIHFLGTRDAQDFIIKTNNEIRKVFTKEGQVQIYSGVSGADDEKSSYALTIQGSEQGIFIQVEEGTPDNDNNFLSFANEEGEIIGRVEGQTLAELLASEEYQNQIEQFTLELISLAADGVGIGIETGGFVAAAASAAASIFFAWQVPGWTTAGVGSAAQIITAATEAIALGDALAEFIRILTENKGVVYESGNGDYAEWLPKAFPTDDLLPGEIIGVKGGKISRATFGADHYMVVSLKPIILGNAPMDATEEKGFEKVAFMGQVPVRVSGPVAVGDYILPSGKNDGLGIAIAPSKLPAYRHKEIVGIAWEAAEDAPVNFVNVGVGLHRNNLADEIQDLSDRVDALVERLELEDHPAFQPKNPRKEKGKENAILANRQLAAYYLEIITKQAQPVWQKNKN